MATVINFGGKQIIEPGVYATTAAQVQNVPQNFSSGNVLIIDTGSGAGFGGGSGSNGELATGLDSVYSFTELSDFKNFVRGGLLWDLADYIFNPLNGVAGAPKVMIARACTTISATKTYTFTGGVSVAAISYTASNTGATTAIIYDIFKAANGDLYAGSFNAMYKSTDDGANWAATGAISGHVYSVIENTNGNFYAATNLGVYKSTNAGGAWALVNTGLTSLLTYDIAHDSTGAVYACTGNGVFKTTNNGTSWAVTGLTGNVVSIDIDSSDNIFVGKPYIGLYKSTNGGTSYTLNNTGITSPGSVLIQAIYVEPGSQDVYLGTAAHGIYKSTNSGANWATLNNGLANLDIRSFSINSSGYLFVGTAIGVQRSIDGVNWTSQNTSLPASFSGAVIITDLSYLIVGTLAVGAYISAAITTGGSPNGGTVTIKTKNEGAAANGTSSASEVRTGYGAQMKAGLIDVDKFIIEFYEGTYRGVDPDGDDYGGVAEADSNQIMISRSIEFDNIQDLIDWMNSDYSFQARFTLSSSNVAGSGAVDSTDLSNNSTLALFAGGTTTYNSSDLDALLLDIAELDNTFFLCDRNATQSQGVQNTKIEAYITNTSEFQKFMIVGGGNDESQFASQSIATAQYYNDKNVVVVHSGFKIPKLVGAGLKTLTSLYHAACIVGRLAGIAPQTPLTFKAIRPTIFNQQLRKADREYALQNGVLHNRFVPGIGFVVNQGINSLQRNTQMINPDGSSCEISVMRIAAQLNKELVLNMRPIFIGGNLNTSSPADVKSFVEGYLTDKTAARNQDNLIIRYQNVTVKQIQDYYKVEYQFVPNSPVNKIFVTGFIIDANLSA